MKLIPVSIKDIARQYHSDQSKLVILSEDFSKVKLSIARHIFRTMKLDCEFDDLSFEIKDFVIDSNVGDIAPEGVSEIKIFLEGQNITEWMLQEETKMRQELDIVDFEFQTDPTLYFKDDEDITPIKEKIESVLFESCKEFEMLYIHNVGSRIELYPKISKKDYPTPTALVQGAISMMNRFHMLNQVMSLNAELIGKDDPKKILSIVSKYIEIVD